MMAAVGNAAPEHGRGLDQHQAERLGETSEASNRARCSSEASSDHAHGEWRRPHLVKLLEIQSLVRPLHRNGAAMKLFRSTVPLRS